LRATGLRSELDEQDFREWIMGEHDDILSDAERELLAHLGTPVASPQCVLVVDDNDVNRQALCIYLSTKDLTCLEAANAAQALEILACEPNIGVMITDLRMATADPSEPQDGLELIRLIRHSRWAALSIIVVSGDTDVAEAVDVMHLGVVDFLLKPVDLDKLLCLVRQELGV